MFIICLAGVLNSKLFLPEILFQIMPVDSGRLVCKMTKQAIIPTSSENWKNNDKGLTNHCCNFECTLSRFLCALDNHVDIWENKELSEENK